MLAACGGSEPTTPPASLPTSIRLTTSTLTFTALFESQDLVATVYDQYGAALTDIEPTWASYDTLIANVDQGGHVTSRGPGSTYIVATAETLVANAQIIVQQSAATVAVSMSRSSLTSLGDTLRLTASAWDSGGSLIERNASWRWFTGDPLILSVDSAGLVTALANGAADVVASVDGAADTVLMTVAQVPATISFAPDSVILDRAGDTARVVAPVHDAGGSEVARPVLTWASSDSLVAVADSTGLVLAVGDGVALIQVFTPAGSGDAVSGWFSVTVNGPPAIKTASLPAALTFRPYAAALEAIGGGGVYSWALTSGALPPGLVLASDGTIAGTPTVVGSGAFTVEVTGRNGLSATRTLTLDIEDALGIATDTLPTGVAGRAYSEALAAFGGDGRYSWALLDGELPPGLELSSDGIISGTPAAAWVATPEVRVTSGDGKTFVGRITVIVYDVLRVQTYLQPAVPGRSYYHRLEARGGSPGYTWTWVGGSPPAGLTFDTDAISGVASASDTATLPDTATFTLQVWSGDGQTATGDFNLIVAYPLAMRPSYVEGGYLNVGYAGQVGPATGGTGPHAYVQFAGNKLPPGLTLDRDTGVISGIPLAAGFYAFEVTVFNGPEWVTQFYSVTISNNPESGFNMWAVDAAPYPSRLVVSQLNAVLARWEAVVTNDKVSTVIPDVVANYCNDEDELSDLLADAYVDDVLVLIDVRDIDGPGGELAYGGPCIRHSAGPRTIVGRLALDRADLESMSEAQVFETTWHEIGHIMGVGTHWSAAGLLSGAETSIPLFTGPRAANEWLALGGSSSGVPVEADGGAGTAYAHWDEAWFDDEIMTGWAEWADERISRMTIASLADLDWIVSYATAEAYSLPFCAPNCTASQHGAEGPQAAPPVSTGGIERVPPWREAVIP